MKQLEINIHLKHVTLKGDLIIPEGATGIVVFSHGSVAQSIQYQKQNGSRTDSKRKNRHIII
jgi:hypothetical protein